MNEKRQNFLERPIHPALPAVTGEIFIFGVILLLSVISRFYDLGTRVMSHDESLHTYFSWLLYKGDGYQHTPMMHGPLQFHLLALSYFLFGVSDFTARIPSVVFSIITIWSLWHWRQYLGKAGALIAAFMMLISPYLLYYGRYVRNEAFSGFAGLLMFWAVLRYLNSGEKRYLYWLTLSLLINFTSKETAFIYAAQMLLFLAVYFVWNLINKHWRDDNTRSGFIIAVSVMVLLVGAVLGVGLMTKDSPTAMMENTAMPANPLADGGMAANAGGGMSLIMLILVLLVVVSIAVAASMLIKGLGWDGIREERSFDLLMLMGTLVLPMLTPFVSKIFGWAIPTTSGELMGLVTRDYVQVFIAIAVGFGLSIALGLWWNTDLWWKNALLFYSLFTVLYTTVFTNSVGFVTGLFGSLGYWLVQQEVARGSQPWYYYVFVQIPIYEFLPAIGVWVGVWFGLRKKSTSGDQPKVEGEAEAGTPPPATHAQVSVFGILLWWVISSVLAYTYAGERMPWLTYHLTIPMILLTAWGLNQLIQKVSWADVREKKGWLGAALLYIFYTSITSAIDTANNTLPFLGKELTQLQNTLEFILPVLVAIASAVGIYWLFREWTLKEAVGLATLVAFGLLSLWTWRAAYRASYVNYDSAKEYLVYAHASTGVKDVIGQLEEISKRSTGDLSALIAYDASAPDTGISWPFVWYLRDFTNLRSFDSPTRSLRDAVAIVVDAKNFSKIEPVVGEGYYRSDYIRMWWPNQDYYNLTESRDPHVLFSADYPCKGVWGVLKLFSGTDFSRVCNAFTDKEMRAAVIDIWARRDFTTYAEVTGQTTLTDITWNPSDEMRLYVRKDVAAQIWSYGVESETPEEIVIDPYEDKTISLSAEKVLGYEGAEAGQFNAPRGIAFAPDGSFYVADSRNHRIQHFDADGEFINMWGEFGDATFTELPGGILNEPWGVAVGPDGSVYVSDTWNHRIQKFDADGNFITMWGYYGQGENPDAFWGPRGIDVDADGHVYVSDTGNKRIVIFDEDGNFITQFGSTGMEPGEFDEQVGVAVDEDGVVYVTDTWNQRVQSFVPAADGLSYSPLNEWQITGWYGQSLDNKPFIAVGDGSVFVTDPEGYRVLQFTPEGELIRTWGDFGYDDNNFGLAAAVAVAPDGSVWVTDAGNHRLMKFILPE